MISAVFPPAGSKIRVVVLVPGIFNSKKIGPTPSPTYTLMPAPKCADVTSVFLVVRIGSSSVIFLEILLVTPYIILSSSSRQQL
jgi:hypothetical protein